MNSPLPSKRAVAKASGFKFYFTGKPCKRGHIAPRYTHGACTKCMRETSDAWRGGNRERTRELSREGYARDPEKALVRAQKFRSEHPQRRKEIEASSQKKKRLREPFYNVLSSVKTRCKQFGLAFDLDNDFLMALYKAQPICPILNKRMLLSHEDGPLRDRASIDRLNLKGDYTRDNVALISYSANTIKSDHTDPAIFLRMAAYVAAGTMQ